MKAFLAACALSALSGCAARSALQGQVHQHCDERPQCVATLVVSNPSEYERSDEVLRFSYDELGVVEGPLTALSIDGSSLAAQDLDTDGDGAADSVFLLVDLPARGAETVFIVRGAAPPLHPRAHAAISGPVIETEAVGYLVHVDGRSGFDLFAKRRPGLALADVELDSNGSDQPVPHPAANVLDAGEAVGIGGYGAWRNGEMVQVAEVKQRSVLAPETGPLFARLVIDYDEWNTGSSVTDVTAELSMAAGSRFVDVDLTMSNPLDRIAVGMARHPNTVLLQGDMNVPFRTWTYVASFGQQSSFGDALGTALLFRRTSLLDQTQDDRHHVTLLGPRDDSLQYSFAAFRAGEENGVSTADELQLVLEREIERRNLQPRIQLSTAQSAELTEAPLTAALALEVSQRLARSERARRRDTLAFNPERSSRRGGPVWTYTTGLLMQAIDDVGAATGDRTLQDYALDVIASFVAGDGHIRTYEVKEHNIDMINSGLMLLRLLDRRAEARFQSAADRVASQFESHPRTSEGAFWHKQIYPHQLWLDGLYMGMPFLAAIGQRRGDETALAHAVNEFQVARSRLRDRATGLYFHAWDEARAQDWADPHTGLSSQFWGRGLGWYAMAVVDTLDYLPAHRTDLRKPLLEIIGELAPALIEHQAQTGVWYQIIDRPQAPGNYPEASASAMFVYFLAKAINQGYLPDSYRTAALRGYRGMLDEFVTVDADGEVHLRSICEVAGLGYGRDGSYRYYMSEPVVTNDPKGTGPMMMAGLQVAELLQGQ